MAFRKLVPQRVQDAIKDDLGTILFDAYQYDLVHGFGYQYNEEEKKFTVESYDEAGKVKDTYELLMVVIPKQSSIHSEVRNG